MRAILARPEAIIISKNKKDWRMLLIAIVTVSENFHTHILFNRLLQLALDEWGDFEPQSILKVRDEMFD